MLSAEKGAEPCTFLDLLDDDIQTFACDVGGTFGGNFGFISTIQKNTTGVDALLQSDRDCTETLVVRCKNGDTLGATRPIRELSI